MNANLLTDLTGRGESLNPGISVAPVASRDRSLPLPARRNAPCSVPGDVESAGDFNSIAHGARREAATGVLGIPQYETRDGQIYGVHGVQGEPATASEKTVQNAVLHETHVDPFPARLLIASPKDATLRVFKTSTPARADRVGAQTDTVVLPRARASSFVNNTSETYYRLRDIALAMQWPKKKVQQRAQKENWPAHQCGNRFEYQVPGDVEALILARPEFQKELPEQNRVKYTDLSADQQGVVLMRRDAVLELIHLLNLRVGKETALEFVVNGFKKKDPQFSISISSLRIWYENYKKYGIDGLTDQKMGKVGRKAFARLLPEHLVLQGQAGAIEYGAGRALNIARSYRDIIASPELPAAARLKLHGNHASKSYVPTSVRDKFRVSQYTTTFIQEGKHAAELDGPYTECDYSNVPAGHAFTCDDMTANCYVWTEFANEKGFILIRPQILAAMDVGSQAWLAVRGVMRPKGQYNKDDAWGLIGDVFDDFGLYPEIVLEGGIWQSNIIRGFKTDFTDAQRIGGLESLGIKAYHAKGPRSKIIENAFNKLQYAADRRHGFSGRNEREDLHEDVKHQKAEVENGKAHPSKYFLHFNQYCEHLQKVMEQLNNERNDGKVLRGICAVEKFSSDNPTFLKVPDSAKYLYRNAMTISTVSKNGVAVRVGSGKYQFSYTYYSIELEEVRGRQVCVFWNDYNPETSAVIFSFQNGKYHKFICLAKYVQPIPRFGATDEQMAIEARRKKLPHMQAVVKSFSLKDYLQRRQHLVEVPPVQNKIGEQIAAARQEQETKESTQRQTRRAIAAVASNITEEDRAEARRAADVVDIPTKRYSHEEITDLLKDNTPATPMAENPFDIKP